MAAKEISVKKYVVRCSLVEFVPDFGQHALDVRP
jgi:hypothetical protein